MRDCIRANRDAEPTAVEEQTTDFVNAAQECRAERDADPAAFEMTYGTNANHRNAFGKCVSARAQEHGGGRRDGMTARLRTGMAAAVAVAIPFVLIPAIASAATADLGIAVSDNPDPVTAETELAYAVEVDQRRARSGNRGGRRR